MGLFGKIKKAAADAVSESIEDGRAAVREKASGTKVGKMAVGAVDGARAKRDENLVEGPHDVRLYIAMPDALAKVKKGKTVRMTVLPNAVKIGGRGMRDGEVALAYDGKPCAYMNDAMGTLAEMARTRPVEMSVTHGEDYLGKDEWTARWYAYDVEKRERENAARYADEDARSVWVNVKSDKWQYPRPMDHETVEPLTLAKSDDGKTLAFSDNDGVALFTVTSRMKAHKELMEHIDAPLEKALVLKRDGDYGEFYRVKIIFAE